MVAFTSTSFIPIRLCSSTAAPWDHQPKFHLPDIIMSRATCLSALEPSSGLVEKSNVATNLEISIFDPYFRRVDLAVLGIQDRAFVAITVGLEVFENNEPQYGFVFVCTRARDAGFWFSLFIVRLG